MGKLNWILSFILAVGLHLGLGIYYIYKPEVTQGARELGESGFEVSISMVAAQVGQEAVEAKEEAEQQEEPIEEIEPVEEVVETPTEEIIEEEVVEEELIEEVVEEIVEEPMEDPIEEVVEEIPEPIIEEPIQEVVEEDVIIFPRPKPRPVVEPILEVPKPIEPVKVVKVQEPTPQPEPKPQSEPRAEPVVEVVKVAEIKLDKSEFQEEIIATNSQGVSATSTDVAERSDAVTQSGGGAFIGQISPEYEAKLRYWLERHKGYPKFSKRRKQEGVVNLKFTMTRDGNVLDYAIVKSSGFEKLDEETIKMLQRAQPLPAFPDEYPGEKKTITIPVQFNLFN